MTPTASLVDHASAAAQELANGLADGSLTEVEVAWSDPFGHAAGKRIPAAQFLQRARGSGFAFCEAALGWNTDATVIDGLRLTNWNGGYPDVHAVPDLSTFRRLPWRAGVGHVISDVVTHDRSPSLLDPRAVLRRVLDRLAKNGYTAKIGVEFEFYLLETDGSPIQHDIHAYSLENANALDPLIGDLNETLGAFVDLEGVQTEYGPGQVETNLVYGDALAAADDGSRLKYAAKEIARKHGKIASFMPSPSPNTREARPTFTSRCGAGTRRPSRQSTDRRARWRCTPLPAYLTTYRRSRSSVPIRSTPTGATCRTRSPPTP